MRSAAAATPDAGGGGDGGVRRMVAGGDVIGDVIAADKGHVIGYRTASSKPRMACTPAVAASARRPSLMMKPRPRRLSRRVAQVTSEVVLRRDRIVTATGRPAEERRATAWLADRPGLDFPYRCVCVCACVCV